MAVIGELATLITAKTAPFDKAIKATGAKARSFSGTISNTLGGAFRKLTGLLNGATAALIGVGGVMSVGALVAKSVKLAAAAEDMQTAYAVYLKDLGKANKIIQQLDKYSGATPFQSMEIKEAGKQLLAFGFTSDELMEKIRVLGDVAAGSQKPIADFVDIMGKVKASGVAAMGDINRLADRGVPIFSELSKVMGVASDQVRTLVGTGKVGFDEVWQAMKNVTEEGGLFQGAVDKLSMTTTGKLSTLKDNIDKIFTEVGAAIVGGLNFKTLTDEFTDLAKTYKQDIVDATIAGVKLLKEGVKGLGFLGQQASMGADLWSAGYHRIAAAYYRNIFDAARDRGGKIPQHVRDKLLYHDQAYYESIKSGREKRTRYESQGVAEILREQRMAGSGSSQQQVQRQTQTIVTIADETRRAREIQERAYRLQLQQVQPVVERF